MDRIFGGSYSSNNPDELLSSQPVSSGSLSPYLNFDPKTLAGNQESQYLQIEGETHQRGSFERAFSLIGSSMILGVSWKMFRQSSLLLRREPGTNLSVLISKMSPRIGKSGMQFGLAALQFSMFTVVLEKIRGEADLINGAIAGTGVGVMKGYRYGRFVTGRYAALGLLLGMALQHKIDSKSSHGAH